MVASTPWLFAPLPLLIAGMLVAGASRAHAQTGDVCAALASLDRGARDGFIALRDGPGTRAIPPSGDPFESFAARNLFAGGIAPRIAVPDRHPASYAVVFSGGSDVAFRRFAAQIDACGLHTVAAEPDACERERGCARTYRFASGASLTLRYHPAVIELAFVAPAPAR